MIAYNILKVDMYTIILFYLNSDFSWAQGYSGSEACYVNKWTICFVCGNNIKFINLKDKEESVLPSPGDGVGALTVSAANNRIGFAELKPNPKIFIYAFPDFTQPRATLEGGCRRFFLTCLVNCNGLR